MTTANTSDRDLWLRVAAFAALYVIWGTTYLAISVAIRTIPPFISGGIRFVLAAALMYAWLRSRSAKPLANLDWRAAALCGALLSGIGNGFVIWAQQGIPSGIAALIVTSVPVLVVVFDWLFFSRRAPSPQASVGTCVALAGVVAIIMHTRSLAGSAEPIFLMSMLVATTAWSVGTLLQRRSSSGQSLLAFTAAQMLFGGLFQLFMATVTLEWGRFEVRAISLESLLAVGYLIVFGSIIAFTSYLWLLTRVAAQKVTTYALVNPVVALFLGALVLQERVTVFTAVAAAMVLGGVALVLFQDGPLRAMLNWLPGQRGKHCRLKAARE
jgi:drug/metabolite transporter (DMT)-like permease